MARKFDDALISWGRGRGRGRGRGHSRRSPARTIDPSTSVQTTVRRRVSISRKKSTVSAKARERGRSVSIKREEFQPDTAGNLPEETSAGGGTVRNMFGGYDKYGVGGARYLERGLTSHDHQFLNELSASEMAILYSYHAGKAMSTGWWAIKSLLVERRKGQTLARENEHIRSELERFRSKMNRGNAGSIPSSSKGKTILIDLSEDEDNDWLELNLSCFKDHRGSYPDSPPPPPPAASLS